MMRFVASVCLAGLVACGGESGEVPSETPDDVAPPATFAEQVAVGQQLYGDSCASCHGASGEGLKAPRLVGLEQGALPLDPPATATVRTTQFRTAADVAAFVVAKMPPGNPGSLAESEYWAILAFALHANGVDLTRTLDAASAATVVLHKE
ncbi:MAG TPA: c-type cytochrome [Polyangiaceae bacterium]|nr:c-type cytochrome [Polyangiaceae bacterium]